MGWEGDAVIVPHILIGLLLNSFLSQLHHGVEGCRFVLRLYRQNIFSGSSPFIVMVLFSGHYNCNICRPRVCKLYEVRCVGEVNAD